MLVVPIAGINSYHAHVYFDGPEARDQAAAVRDLMAERFSLRIGRWHEQPIGPHEYPMYQVAFADHLFATFVPWLMLNRQELTVLVHPNTGAPRRDHLVHALWLGTVLKIIRPEQLPEQTLEQEDNTPTTRPTMRP